MVDRCRVVLYFWAVAHLEHMDGTGAVVFDPDGRVQLVVSGELGELLDQAAARGITADQILTSLLEEAENATTTEANDHSGSREPRPVPSLPEAAGLQRAPGLGLGGGDAQQGGAGGLRPLPPDEPRALRRDCDGRAARTPVTFRERRRRPRIFS